MHRSGHLPDMFGRHPSSPDQDAAVARRDRIGASSPTVRSSQRRPGPDGLRDRLAAPGTVGLRDRLGQTRLGAA
jgi:hypothetical protein